ncbi:MAG: 23S rRNA (uracil(1939)-C(5))-methyltransferase RlmD [Nitrospiraceae bacterium]
MAETVRQVTIEKLVQGGRGLARQNGRVVLVRGAIPGETVSLVDAGKHKGVQEATIGKVLSASPDRVPAPCPVYEQCGGCQLQHLGYEAQLVQKQVILRETLARLGKIAVDDLPPVMPSPDPYGYRSTVRFMVFRPGKSQDKGLALGFHREGSHEPVPASGCLLAFAPMREAATLIDERLAKGMRLSLHLESVEIRYSVSSGSLLLIHHTGPAKPDEAQTVFGLFQDLPKLVGQVLVAQNGKRWVQGQDWIEDRLDEVTFRISDRSFMQTNWRLAERLSKTMADWLGPLEGVRVLELYAGIGMLGLSLARAGALVTEVEANEAALADSRHAAKVNHIGRCRFRPLTAEAMLAEMQSGDYDLILMAPPRTGLSADCVQELLRVGTGRLLYLSCDPATLARDLGRLSGGGYRIVRMQAFDMFPQTAHIETLVELAR